MNSSARELSGPPMAGRLKETREVVYLVDDDLRIREALSELLASVAIEHVSFGSATEFLRWVRNDTIACLVLDVQLPDMNGLDLQRELAGGCSPPIVFMSGYPDVPSAVRAMKAGAVEFLTKPINPQHLLSSIRSAFTVDLERRQTLAELTDLQQRFTLLTPREREVLPLIAGGMLNKQAAAFLGITDVTLQVHRGQIMRKMRAGSFAELVRMAAKLQIHCANAGGRRTTFARRETTRKPFFSQGSAS